MRKQSIQLFQSDRGKKDFFAHTHTQNVRYKNYPPSKIDFLNTFIVINGYISHTSRVGNEKLVGLR